MPEGSPRLGVVLTVVLTILTIAFVLVAAAGLMGTAATWNAGPAAADSPLSTAQAAHFMLANLIFGVAGLVGMFGMWNAKRWGFGVAVVALLALFLAQLTVGAAGAPMGFRSHGRELTTLGAALVLAIAVFWNRRRFD
jgi:hypothetical protein